MLHITFHMWYVAFHISHATYQISHATCHISDVTSNMSHITRPPAHRLHCRAISGHASSLRLGTPYRQREQAVSGYIYLAKRWQPSVYTLTGPDSCNVVHVANTGGTDRQERS